MSVPTAIKTLNLTVYSGEDGGWFVNDARVVNYVEVMNGYVFEVDRYVSSL